MITSTYDQVLKMIKRLNLPEQVQLLETLCRMVRARMTEAKPHSIMELEGLGANVWQILIHKHMLTMSVLRGSLDNN